MPTADDKARTAAIAQSLDTAASLGPDALQAMIRWHSEHNGEDATRNAMQEQINLNIADLQREPDRRDSDEF